METKTTNKVRLKRHPERGDYTKQKLYEILDEAWVCHVAFEHEGPVVIPTAFARDGDRLVLHGAVASRMMKSLDGSPLCICVTLLDGLVFAKSAFHHSMNYRSAVIFGDGHQVLEPSEKSAALSALVERMSPGRSEETRGPSDKELRATSVITVDLSEASVKFRKGAPVDAKDDHDLPYWAGVVPLSLRPSAPTFGTGELPRSIRQRFYND